MITKRQFLASAAAIPAYTALSPEAAAQSKLPLVLDIDTGRDDAWTLLGALDRFEVAAVLSSYGNTTLSNAVRNSLDVTWLGQKLSHHISAYELRLPVFAGESHPGDTAPAAALAEIERRAGVNGNGLCNVHIEQSPKSALGANGLWLEPFTDMLRQKGQIDYVACGPLTNLAALIEHFDAIGDPTLKQRIHTVAIMGGSFDAERPIDFNFKADPDAARRVLSFFGRQVRLFPSDETTKLRLTEEQVRALKTASPLAAFNKEVMLAYINGWSPDHAVLLHDPSTLLAFESDTRFIDERVTVSPDGKILRDPEGALIRRFSISPGLEQKTAHHILSRYMGLRS